MFLNQIEHEVSQIPDKYVVVWDKLNYVTKDKKQRGNKTVYKGVSFNDKYFTIWQKQVIKYFWILKATDQYWKKEIK